MRTTLGRQLYTYWNDVRQGRLAPKRFEIEPARFAEHLPDTFILERVAANAARFRLAGTRMSEAFGTEFRATNIYDLFDHNDRLVLQRQISVISRQGAVGVFIISAGAPTGERATFEMLLLPLIHSGAVVDRFLGVLAPMDAPDWLGGVPLTSVKIEKSELVWPDGRPHALIDAQARQEPFAAHIRNARIVRVNRRQFRVYDGGLSDRDDDTVR
jgi:hypothetical protein